MGCIEQFSWLAYTSLVQHFHSLNMQSMIRKGGMHPHYVGLLQAVKESITAVLVTPLMQYSVGLACPC